MLLGPVGGGLHHGVVAVPRHGLVPGMEEEEEEVGVAEEEEVEEEVVEVAGEEEPEAWRVVSHSRSSASGTRCGRWM